MTVPPEVMKTVAQFHTALKELEAFDSENVRPKVETKESHPDREFAVVSTYLRSLAQVRTLKTLGHPSHFQTIAMIARALFELATDLYLVDQVERGPEKFRAFSEWEKLRSARRITAFFAASKEAAPRHLFVYDDFIKENGASIESKARDLWPKQMQTPKPKLSHWSARDLRQRALMLGAPFDKIYDVHYAELSWYTHPGVGAITALDVDVYPLICGSAYGNAVECYVEILQFMMRELLLSTLDPLVTKKLEFARLVAFADGAEQRKQLRHELLGV